MKDTYTEVCAWIAATGQAQNPRTVSLYCNLVAEEYAELQSAENAEDELDAICDLMWVLMGLAYARGYKLPEAFEEVTRSNYSKFTNGECILRADGKILKPDTFSPPDLREFV